jgi:hypothetical protein
MPFSASFYLLVCAAAAAAISASTAVASAQDICPGDLSSYVNQVCSAPSAVQICALKSRGRCSLTTRSCWQGRCLASMSEPAPTCVCLCDMQDLLTSSAHQVQVLNGSVWQTLHAANNLQYFSPASNTKVVHSTFQSIFAENCPYLSPPPPPPLPPPQLLTTSAAFRSLGADHVFSTLLQARPCGHPLLPMC